MKVPILVLILSISFVTGCGRPTGPTDEEMKKFITESEEIKSVLVKAFEQGRTLSYDEERNFVQYTVVYDKESEFQESADDPSISMVVTSASMMELQLGKTDHQSIEDFQKYKSELETELAVVNEKVD